MDPLIPLPETPPIPPALPTTKLPGFLPPPQAGLPTETPTAVDIVLPPLLPLPAELPAPVVYPTPPVIIGPADTEWIVINAKGAFGKSEWGVKYPGEHKGRALQILDVVKARFAIMTAQGLTYDTYRLQLSMPIGFDFTSNTILELREELNNKLGVNDVAVMWDQRY